MCALFIWDNIKLKHFPWFPPCFVHEYHIPLLSNAFMGIGVDDYIFCFGNACNIFKTPNPVTSGCWAHNYSVNSYSSTSCERPLNCKGMLTGSGSICIVNTDRPGDVWPIHTDRHTDTETDTENDTADVKIPYCSRPREVKGLQPISQFGKIFGFRFRCRIRSVCMNRRPCRVHVYSV